VIVRAIEAAGRGDETMRQLLLISIVLVTGVIAVPAAGNTERSGRVQEPELQHEIVHLQHISPKDAERALMPFLGRYGRLDQNTNLGTLTIVDEPALVQKMLDVLTELDVPRKSWEFRILLVQARKTEAESVELGPLTDYPDVAREIQSLFRFDQFEELDSLYIKVMDGDRATLEVGGAQGFGVDVVPHTRGDERVEVEFHLYRTTTHAKDAQVTVLKNTVVQTSFETASGETTIVGASRLNGDDTALITVMETR